MFNSKTIGIFAKSLIFLFIGIAIPSFAQEIEGPKPPKINDYKNDTSYTDFNSLRYKVAKAQINLLKNGGALFVRLKTNALTISKLKAAGNIDLATQLERETMLTNKIIVGSYLQELTFCPVYFFYSNTSDSVKHKKLEGVFVDSNLVVNPAIVCNANFYLIAESGQVYNSSLGIVPESEAAKSIERGTASREAEIVIKNRYYIQLHKPFPYFQIHRSFNSPIMPSPYGVSIDLKALHSEIKKMLNNSADAKQIIGLQGCVRAFNERLYNFYDENKDYAISHDLMQFVY
ncbi:MAG: hypothetical protein H7141_14020 [Burkholderiales bacterium]|nr:hypothetical protein [Bacteroidia bacterium]